MISLMYAPDRTSTVGIGLKVATNRCNSALESRMSTGGTVVNDAVALLGSGGRSNGEKVFSLEGKVQPCWVHRG